MGAVAESIGTERAKMASAPQNDLIVFVSEFYEKSLQRASLNINKY